MRRYLIIILTALFSLGVLSSNAANPETSLYQAHVYVEAGRISDAINILKTFESDSPAEGATVNLLLGKIFLAIDRPARALELFEEADFQNMDDPALLIGLAQANLKLGHFKEAKKFATGALKMDPESGDPELVLALVEHRSGDIQAGLHRMNRLTTVRPDSESIALVYARYLALTSDPTTAISILRSYLKSNASVARVLDYAGELEFKFGDKAAAIAMRKRAVQIFIERGDHFRKDVTLAWLESNEHVGIEKPLLKEKRRTSQAANEGLQDVKKNDSKTAKPSNEIVAIKNGVAISAQEVLFPPQKFPFPAGVNITGGSGFIVDGGKKVVTNRHVIEGGKEFAVRTGLGEMINAKVIYVSQTDDLAILELQKPLTSDRAVPSNAYVKPGVGRPVVVMGYPLWYLLGENSPSLTNGIVSKASGMQDDAKTFQLTAKVNKGNSGGPVFDMQGNVVGITVGKLDSKKINQEQGFIPEDVNFAIHIDRLPAIANITLSKSDSTSEPLNSEELYRVMLGRVVMVATYK